MGATNHVCKIQMLNYSACPVKVTIVSRKLYMSSNSLSESERDDHMGNSRQKQTGG